MTSIETLLPQRYPFLFVNEIISATMDEIIGIQTYDNFFLYYQGHFPDKKTVPNVILLESMVQCGGAGVTQLDIFEKVLWVLASVENVQFLGSVQSNSTVRMVVKTIKISDKILKQTGTASCQDQVILEATWLCLKMNLSSGTPPSCAP